MSIKVLLVDDHKIIRDGLSAILQTESDICIVAEAGSGQEALDKVKQSAPDVVVMDLTLPDMGGVQVTRRILADYPATRVLVLTMFLDDNCVFESLDAGARGYLVKDCAAEELVLALRAIHQGKPYFCTGAQEIMMRKCLPGAADSSNPALTKRETEVLKLTAQGLNTKEIAFQLGVSIKMIEVHRMNLRKKLGLHSIAQLTTYALKNRLITV
ncbi:two component transcriptional regulator, LuxR family [Trichlorobacter thiogenes]|uniref:Two component transcriptional regulator, LuxR family n=1 Tax=Trichlorobacter thiogenes TaxID=115783 RepID=A0A1T4L026_9BACT|nr:response regulator transcription factor [Trichlorobacter thiogenes]SJZ48084.1 two component transcriptional regulator, LuxR family [Trichlorobacter thiogenes]